MSLVCRQRVPVMESDRDDGEPSDHGKSREKTLFPATSLFPIANAESGADNKPQWLCNPSFSVDVSKIAGSGEGAAFDVWQERDEERPSDTQKRPSYELLETSSSYSSDSRDKGRRRRKKKKKKRKTGNSHDLAEETSRKSSARAWVSSRRKPEKDYYFHVRGDRDNLAFGSLYKMDVARFKRHDLDPSDLDILRSKSFIKGNIVLELEGDVNSMGNKAKSEGRYYSVKYSTLERHKQLKRICFLHAERSYIIAEEFIPLSNLSSLENDSITELQPDLENEESLEDQIIRKTKEFNKTTRDFPHDEKAWLAFADYQDQLVSMQSTKAARLQALDKKISVLEKAVELNTDNEELLLYLMKAYKSKDSTSILERWERILAQHPGSSKLWKEFLRDCQSEFSRFRTSDMRKMYSHALQALSSTSKKLCTQAHQFGKLPKDVPEILQIEQGLVDIFVNLCRFEWQTGHQELATGLFQAEIDYSLFSPSLLLSEQNKLRLFEHFWNDDGARLGEDEAIGWGEWIEKEEENRQKAKLLEESILESEPGGWTGWTEVKLKGSDVGQVSPHLLESMSDEDDDSGEHESNDTAQDLPALLAKLGIDVNTEADADITDTSVWKKWAEEEAMRDSEQWLPLHRKAEKDGEEQLSRVITFEDVGEYLFSLCSDDARFSLVSQFVDFFDGPIARWTFTNSPSWSEKLRNSENFSRSMLKDIEDAQELNQNNSSFNTFNMDHIFSSSTNVNTRVSILKFLQNVILLLMKVFPRNLILEETVLRSDILFETTRSSLVNELTPCRGLAKSLLKKDRQDLILCGVYARCEAAFGCIGVARKVFDMAMSSMEGLSSELQVNGSLLYLWYAEMEVSNQTITGSRERAIYILSCLGSGAKYSTSICEISSTLLLRARQGFKEKIRASRSYWARGEIKDQSIALVCSAALFEELTSGWASAKGIFDDAFSMVLPGRRSQSCQLESLFLYYIMMLKRNMKQATLSRSWETILLGLDLYPYNSKIFAAIIEVGSTYTVPYNIRRLFDDCCQKKPSILVWIFSLLSELKKEGLQNRVHGLFERALASDEMQKSVILWRCYLAYELHLDNPASAKRIFFRAIHACPWSKKLWLDGFQKLNSFLTAKELSDLQEVMRDKELNLRTDIYEILLQDETS